MDHFQRNAQGVLAAEEVSLKDIAKEYGTPTFVYAKATIERHVRVLREGVKDVPHSLCYAIKANSNLAILETLAGLGCDFDAVSIGEFVQALKAGAKPEQVILSGVGKRDDEMRSALKWGARYICVESIEELKALEQIACHEKVCAPVAVRVNPDVDAKTHPYIATGLKQNKFGVAWNQVHELYRWGQERSALSLIGVTCHIGSQLTTMDPFIDAAKRIGVLAGELLERGVPLRDVGMGGGLGIPYTYENPPTPKEYGQALSDILKPLGLNLVLEPGRVIVGNAGILLAKVVRIKEGSERVFVILDAGMNDLIRPALYQATHRLEKVEVSAANHAVVDVVGPICESADTFLEQESLGSMECGDLVALRSSGAYASVMASHYNGRPHVAEVLVDGKRAQLIKKRESIADLWRGEFHLQGDAADSTYPLETGSIDDE